MTRLTTVGHVPPPQRQGAERQPTRDFAQALAKDGEAANPGLPEQVAVAQAHVASAHPPAAVKPPMPMPMPVPHSTTTDAPTPNQSFTDGVLMAAERASLAVVVNPVGMTEAVQYARVFGAHLLPDRYLSEVAVCDAAGQGSAPATWGDAVRSGTRAPVPSQQENGLSAFLRDGDEPPSVQDAAVAAVETESEAETSLQLETSSSGVAESGGAAALVWSERTIRITGEREGHAVAWIRDYRLDRRNEEKLVQAVLQEARTQGVMLRKVIVNGREAWASREAI